MKKLKQRWGVTSNFQLVLILLVFAFTGSSSAYIAKPFLAFIELSRSQFHESFWKGGFLYYLLYIILIFPFYQLLLLIYGWIFGQFRFFWNFEKKMLKRMGFKRFFKA